MPDTSARPILSSSSAMRIPIATWLARTHRSIPSPASPSARIVPVSAGSNASPIATRARSAEPSNSSMVRRPASFASRNFRAGARSISQPSRRVSRAFRPSSIAWFRPPKTDAPKPARPDSAEPTALTAETAPLLAPSTTTLIVICRATRHLRLRSCELQPHHLDPPGDVGVSVPEVPAAVVPPQHGPLPRAHLRPRAPGRSAPARPGEAEPGVGQAVAVPRPPPRLFRPRVPGFVGAPASTASPPSDPVAAGGEGPDGEAEFFARASDSVEPPTT